MLCFAVNKPSRIAQTIHVHNSSLLRHHEGNLDDFVFKMSSLRISFDSKFASLTQGLYRSSTFIPMHWIMHHILLVHAVRVYELPHHLT